MQITSTFRLVMTMAHCGCREVIILVALFVFVLGSGGAKTPCTAGEQMRSAPQVGAGINGTGVPARKYGGSFVSIRWGTSKSPAFNLTVSFLRDGLVMDDLPACSFVNVSWRLRLNHICNGSVSFERRVGNFRGGGSFTQVPTPLKWWPGWDLEIDISSMPTFLVGGILPFDGGTNFDFECAMDCLDFLDRHLIRSQILFSNERKKLHWNCNKLVIWRLIFERLFGGQVRLYADGQKKVVSCNDFGITIDRAYLGTWKSVFRNFYDESSSFSPQGLADKLCDPMYADILLLAAEIVNYMHVRKGIGIYLGFIHFLRSRYPVLRPYFVDQISFNTIGVNLFDFDFSNMINVDNRWSSLNCVPGPIRSIFSRWDAKAAVDELRALGLIFKSYLPEGLVRSVRKNFTDEEPRVWSLKKFVDSPPSEGDLFAPQGAFDTPQIKSILSLVSVLFAFYAFGREKCDVPTLMRNVESAARGQSTVTRGADMIGNIIAHLHTTFSTFKSFYQSGCKDFQSFLGYEQDMRDMMLELERFELKMDDSKFEDGTVGPVATPLITQIAAGLATMETKIQQYSTNPSVSRSLYNRLSDRFTAVTKRLHVYAKAALSERPCPYSLMLFGHPGTGKTVLLNAITEQFRRDSPFDPDQSISNNGKGLDSCGVYNYTLGNSSQDTYMTGAANFHWAMILDDMAAIRQSIGGEALSNMVSGIITLVNNTVVATPQASLDSKGKIFNLHQLVIGTTNSDDLQAYTAAACPGAILRRFTWVEVEVKASYRKPSTTQLDPAKIEASMLMDTNGVVIPGQLTDAHIFRVYTYDVHGTDVQRRLIREITSTAEFMSFLRVQWKTFATQQLNRLKTQGRRVFKECEFCGNVGAVDGVCPAGCVDTSQICTGCGYYARIFEFDDQGNRVIPGSNLPGRQVRCMNCADNPVFRPQGLSEEMSVPFSSVFYYNLFRLGIRDPLSEEVLKSAVKHLGGCFGFPHLGVAQLFSFMFAVFEICLKIFAYGFSMLSVWPFFMHIAIAKFSFKVRLLIHAISNAFFVLAFELDRIGTIITPRGKCKLVLENPTNGTWKFDLQRGLVIQPLAWLDCSFDWIYTVGYFLYTHIVSLIFLIASIYACYLVRRLYVRLSDFSNWRERRHHVTRMLTVAFVQQVRSEFQSLFSDWCRRWRVACNYKYIAATSAILAIISAVWFMQWCRNTFQPHGNTSSKVEISSEQIGEIQRTGDFWSSSQTTPIPSITTNPGVNPDSFVDQVHAAVGELYVTSDPGVAFKILNIGGDTLVMTKHEALRLIDKLPAMVTVKYAGGRYSRYEGLMHSWKLDPVDVDVVTAESDVDVAFVRSGGPTLRCLRKYFRRQGEVDSANLIADATVVGIDGRFIAPVMRKQRIRVQYQSGVVMPLGYAGQVVGDDVELVPKNGDCGRVLYNARKGSCYIAGIHFAGHPPKNLHAFIPISKDLIDRYDATRRCKTSVKIEDNFRMQGTDMPLVTAGCYHKCAFDDDYIKRGMKIMGGNMIKVFYSLGKYAQAKRGNTDYIESQFKEFWATKRWSHVDVPYVGGCVGDFVPRLLPPHYQWLPKHRFASVASEVKDYLSRGDVATLAACYLKRLRNHDIFMQCVRQLRFLSDHETINGVPGEKYVKSMNMQKSAGFPYNKPKSAILEEAECGYELTEAIAAKIADMESAGRRGNSLGIFFTATLKDEPVKIGKIKPPSYWCSADGELLPPSSIPPTDFVRGLEETSFGKIRVFQAINFEGLFIIRKYFLGLVALLQRFNTLSCIAVGLNCFSKEWQDLYRHMRPPDFSDRDVFNHICGDFTNYDQRISNFLLEAAWSVLIDLLRESAGFRESDDKGGLLRLWWSIADGVSNPFTWFFGDLVQLSGTNPSGHPLTVILNGIVNYFYMLYAFQQIYPDRNFDDFVRIMTYGDDNILSVHPSCGAYNQVTITHELAQIGVIYTDSEKKAVDEPYVTEMTFLKRKWKSIEHLHNGEVHVVCTCPIDLSSVSKMLSVETKRADEFRRLRIINVLCSAMFEMFQFGRRESEHFRGVAESFIKEYSLQTQFETILPRGWPNYDEYMDCWIGESIYQCTIAMEDGDLAFTNGESEGDTD